jgi:serine/threonine protein kinase
MSTSQVERVVDNFRACWESGERPAVEDYLAAHPALAQQPELALELIYEELCLRRQLDPGTTVDADHYARRFPQFFHELQVLLAFQDVLESSGDDPFPAAGDKLGGFLLLAELARGSNGRVFLARQPALADRLVVLKVVPKSGLEHLSLARVQHTHIVPLYSVEEFADRGLRALCMPYFGGATLATVMSQLSERPQTFSGQDILQILRQSEPSLPVDAPHAKPACKFIAAATQEQIVCWLGAALADALNFVHERGLLHLDIKPSNILWAADGQPLLLDLHLAREPIPADGTPPLAVGGTPAYMSPEQSEALRAARERRPIQQPVDGRADIYSLGLVLWELLSSRLPQAKPTSAQLRRENRRVSVGLADILEKCLATEPRDRYSHAGALARDLRLQLTDRPLRGVRNRSLTERWRKWRRRRPYGTLMLGLSLAATAIVCLMVAYLFQETRRAAADLHQGKAAMARGDYPAAQAALRHGLEIANGLPFTSSLVNDLRHEAGIAQQSLLAADLHRFAEELRTLYDGPLPPDEAASIEQRCNDFWSRREAILRELESCPQPEQVRTDLLDIGVLSIHLRMRAAGTRSDAERSRALRLFTEAEQAFGPSCLLDCERQVLGLPTDGTRRTPRTAWEYYAVGRAALENGRPEEALQAFERALALQPQLFWANFHKGKCALSLGRHQDAVLAFTVCIVLAPDRGWCYFNRGVVYEASGDKDRALQDYHRARQLEPKVNSQQ